MWKGNFTNINKSFSNRDTYVERHVVPNNLSNRNNNKADRPRRLDHNNSRQVMSNAKKLNDLRNMLEQKP